MRRWQIHVTGDAGYRIIEVENAENPVTRSRSFAFEQARELYFHETGRPGTQLLAVER